MKYLNIYWIWVDCTISITIENFDSCGFIKKILTSFSFKWALMCWKKNCWKIIFIWKITRTMLKVFTSKSILYVYQTLNEINMKEKGVL